MRIAISNIAWDMAEDEQVSLLLRKYCVDAIDVAPGKYFREPRETPAKEVVMLRNWWAGHGIEITGMQSLLFGSTGMNLFGSSEIQVAMLDYLNTICHIASNLGAKRLVFGSPKNRNRSGLSDEDTAEIAVSFFHRLGDIAGNHGVVICLEPNPSCYGSNFMMNSYETAKIVSGVAHPAIRMQLDTGALTINDEDPHQIIREYAHLIGHVHASEPGLVTLGDGKTDHAKVASALSRYLDDQVVSIEMLPAKGEPHIVAIERALQVAVRCYRGADSRLEDII
jgi:sugar phosphate isomerase/epimerase